MVSVTTYCTMKKLITAILDRWFPISDPVLALLAHFASHPRSFRVVFDPVLSVIVLRPEHVYDNRSLLLGVPLSSMRIVIRNGQARVFQLNTLRDEIKLNWRESVLLCAASRRWCEASADDMEIEVLKGRA